MRKQVAHARQAAESVADTICGRVEQLPNSWEIQRERATAADRCAREYVGRIMDPESDASRREQRSCRKQRQREAGRPQGQRAGDGKCRGRVIARKP